jgi:hypothetical protein
MAPRRRYTTTQVGDEMKSLLPILLLLAACGTDVKPTATSTGYCMTLEQFEKLSGIEIKGPPDPTQPTLNITACPADDTECVPSIKYAGRLVTTDKELFAAIYSGWMLFEKGCKCRN